MLDRKPTSTLSFWIWIAAALAAVLGVSGVLLVKNAPQLLSAAIHEELATRGFETARFEVEDVAWGRLRLTHLTIGDPVTLRLPEVTISYSFSSLLTGHLDEVRLKELEIRGNLGPDGLSLGAVDSLRGTTSVPVEPGAPQPARPVATAPEIPVDRLEIDDARIHIETEDGPLEGELWMSLDDSRHLAFRFQSTVLDAAEKLTGYALAPFSIDGEATLDPQQRSLRLQPLVVSLDRTETPSAALTIHVPSIEAFQKGGLDADVRLQASGGAIELAEPAIEIEGIEFDVDWNPSSGLPKGRVEVARVRSAGRDPWVAPLSLKASLEPGRDDALTADIDLTDPSRHFILRVHATQDFQAASGRARIRLAPVEFGANAADLGRLLPGIARLGIEASGRVTLSGEARWGGETPEVALAVGLKNVSASVGSTRVSCLNGVIELRGPPFETDGVQEVSMARLDIGLQLREGLVRFRWQPSGGLVVERGEWSTAGGKVLTAGEYDPARETQDFLLAIDHVQLAELVTLLPIEGLSGSGALSGRLPLRFYKDRVEIQGGVLASEGAGGWLRYRPEGGTGRLADYGVPELMDLEAALENFEFTRMELHVNGDTRGVLEVRITLAGANPTHLDGHPYILNLNVEGKLIDLYSGGAVAYEIPTRIETALSEAFGEPENTNEVEPSNPCQDPNELESEPLFAPPDSR